MEKVCCIRTRLPPYGVRGDLETKLTELYAGTEVPAAAVADRQATALRKYDADSLAKLDKLETSRKATEKAEPNAKNPTPLRRRHSKQLSRQSHLTTSLNVCAQLLRKAPLR